MTIPIPNPVTLHQPLITLEKLACILRNEGGKYSLPERFRALFALKALDNDDVVEIIGNVLSTEKSSLLKHELAYVLGQMRRPSALPILREVLVDLTGSHETIVRHEAAEALGAIGCESSLELLKSHALDENEAVAVRETCNIAIDLLTKGKEEAPTATSTNDLIFASVDPAPPMKEPRSITELAQQLMDRSLDLYTRYKAMFALRNRGINQEAILALCQGFLDPSALFRHEIAYVLGQVQHPASIPALTKVLRNRDEVSMVRHEAAEALGSIATPECLEILKEFEMDPEPVVRESCQVARDMYEYETSSELNYFPANLE